MTPPEVAPPETRSEDYDEPWPARHTLGPPPSDTSLPLKIPRQTRVYRHSYIERPDSTLKRALHLYWDISELYHDIAARGAMIADVGQLEEDDFLILFSSLESAERGETHAGAGVAPAASQEELAVSELQNLFEKAEEMRFEDGMETEVSRGLRFVLTRYGLEGCRALANVIRTGAPTTDALMETLHFLGRFDDPPTKDECLRILVTSLKHPSPIVRDAAAIGLAYMDDKRAISTLKKAAKSEPIKDLRADLVEVVRQLEG